MIDLEQYEIFVHHRSTLKETSLDDRDGSVNAYMTDSMLDVVDFDGVKEEYIRDLQLCETPKSNDALFNDGCGCLVFAEFKNGFINRTEQFSIRKKIYDSVLMFSDITSMGISEMRKMVKYILVYNESANQANILDKELQKKQRAQPPPSPALDNFAKTMGKLAKEEYICFGLSIFRNYCFKEVHTYTKTEFEDYLSGLKKNAENKNHKNETQNEK